MTADTIIGLAQRARSDLLWMRHDMSTMMYFIIGANVADSMTTGMGRQMHGLRRCASGQGPPGRLSVREATGIAVGPGRLSRLEAPFRAAMQVRKLAAANASAPIAILHEQIGWPDGALFAPAGTDSRDGLAQLRGPSAGRSS